MMEELVMKKANLKKVHMRKAELSNATVYSCDIVIRGKRHHKYRSAKTGRFVKMY